MKTRGWLILPGVAVAALLAAYFASPVIAFNSLAEAGRAGDRGRLERLVDFPAVRDSLKSQLTARIQAQIQRDRSLKDNPFGGLGLLIGSTMIDAVIDATVTPDGISAMVRSSRAPMTQPTAPGKTALPPPPETAAPAPSPDAAPAEKPKTSFAYQGLDRFEARTRSGGDSLGWVMERKGLFGWKLTGVELPQTR